MNERNGTSLRVPSCVCGEINIRHCPIHGNGPEPCVCGHPQADHGHPATPSFTGCLHGWSPASFEADVAGCPCDEFEAAEGEAAAA